MATHTLQSLARLSYITIACSTAFYLGVLGLLTIPFFQNHALYLNRVTLTWFKDLDVPETFGFLKSQVTPFAVETSDGEGLHAWHVLPLQLYRRNERELIAEPSGFAPRITDRKSFRLLRDDPESRLVLYFHGVAGTVGSGWRPDSYRALYSGAPDKIHVLAADYRGFGKSTGEPSEAGLIDDAIALATWAMTVAGIPPSRIVIYGQSLGTAVSIALLNHFATQPSPVHFAGTVLTASLTDISTLLGTYRVGGLIPVLSPLKRFPSLMRFFTGFLRSTWLSKDRIAQFIQSCEKSGSRYHITMIHAEDDEFIPWSHTEQLYWRAVNATTPLGLSFDDLEDEKNKIKLELAPVGWVVEWHTDNGLIREEILKAGIHDQLMSWPVTTIAILRAFESAGLEIEK